jgi:hypothetical protein
MMVEGHLWTMIKYEFEKGDYYRASLLALAYTKLLNIPANEIPTQPFDAKTRNEAHFAWEHYFFNLLNVLIKYIKVTIDDVRKRYVSNRDIPMVQKIA